MTKQHRQKDQGSRVKVQGERDEVVIPAKAGIQEIKGEAELLLCDIIYHTASLTELLSEYENETKTLAEKYAAKIEAFEALKKSAEIGIMQIMKFNKKILFADTDVINLRTGSLIRNTGDHVTIPKTALEACKENKFTDVIKVVESLDRDKIEKWPDAKLTLIGAERTKKEEFKYSLIVKRET
jgi:hypothetical protein